MELLAQWNLCLSALASFAEAGRGDSSSNDVGGKNKALMTALLPCVMRAGRTFLDSLLRGAFTYLNSMFRLVAFPLLLFLHVDSPYKGIHLLSSRNHGSEVMTFLRNVQQLTRFLQRLCVHAKTKRAANLTAQIPQTRKSLEAFVCSVKVSPFVAVFSLLY